MVDQGRKKSWFGAAFGMLFLVSGLWVTYNSAGKMIGGYIASMNWVEVPATIHDVNLVSKSGETTTYHVTSNYSYEFKGAVYRSDKVSLSTGSDNIGDYWEALEQTLLKRQHSNEAFAIINPANPSESLLDRTIRWKSIAFASIFIIMFCGFGAWFSWFSLRGTNGRKAQLQKELSEGINSEQKTGHWVLAVFGFVFLAFGIVMAILAMPDAIRDKQYGALAILLFPLTGIFIWYFAFKQANAFRRFGSTPLFLDPAEPSVGGQLGGRLSVNVLNQSIHSNVAPQLKARLTCTRKSRSGKHTSYAVQWQGETPVLLVQTSRGYDVSFVFDIPSDSVPSEAWTGRSTIEWKVTIEGEFHEPKLGKYERVWKVFVGHEKSKNDSGIRIPDNVISKYEHASAGRIKTSALEQVPVIEDDQYISVSSDAGRNRGELLVGILFGVVFTGAGVFTIIQNWLPGYIFILVGGFIVLTCLYMLGKSIAVQIDKHSRMLSMQASWLGIVFSRKLGSVIDSKQFKLKKTSSTNSHNKVIEYYALIFEFDNQKIRIADGIKGKSEAAALREAIVDACFESVELDVAA